MSPIYFWIATYVGFMLAPFMVLGNLKVKLSVVAWSVAIIASFVFWTDTLGRFVLSFRQNELGGADTATGLLVLASPMVIVAIAIIVDRLLKK